LENMTMNAAEVFPDCSNDYTSRTSIGRTTLIILGLICLSALPARADWPNTNETKWVQYPDTNGIDVLMSQPLILADDFLCMNTGPITDIHLWTSWLNDQIQPVPFIVSIWNDVPVSATNQFSHPGTNLLWQQTFLAGQYQYREWTNVLEEWFWNPEPLPFGQLIGFDHVIWQYNFYPTNPFVQEGTPTKPVVYWLSVTVPMPAQIGWKTSTNHWNDDAVFGHVDGQGNPLHDWMEMYDPRDTNISLDLSFALTTKAEEGLMDFGDAPDPTYPTLLVNNGARHVIVPGVMLGQAIDAEANGQPNATATGDDIAGVNDDDGVTYVGNMIPGQNYAINVIASVNGSLNAWVDFNGDGSWAQAGDQVFNNQALVAGNNALSFAVPNNATWGAVAFARFRFNTAGGLSYTNAANDGEVEDYAMNVEPLPQQDLGDAPSSFNNIGPAPGTTMMAYPAAGTFAFFPTAVLLPPPAPPYGPIHGQPLGIGFLGANVTFESNADLGADQDLINNIVPATGAADLDGADDGVTLPLTLPHATQTTLNYSVTFPAPPVMPLGQLFVNVWFDWNRDGDWNDTMTCPNGTPAPEWAVQNQAVAVPVPPQPYPVVMAMVTPPFTAWHAGLGIQPVWMRITLAEQPWVAPGFSGGGVGGDGPMNGYLYGETEDYYLTNYDAQQTFDFGDAPSPYPTLLAASGAQHLLVPSFWLGGALDSEVNGQPDPAAMGDDNNGVPDDEDGVTWPAVLLVNTSACVSVTLTGPSGLLDAWVDFNGNGAWDAGEQVFTNLALAGGANPGLCFSVPLNAKFGTNFARFRLSTTGGLAPTGVANDGEVEDYLVSIAQPRPATNVVITSITVTNLTSPAAQAVTVYWNAQTNLYYQLQAAATLTNSPIVWSNVSPMILGPLNSYTETNSPMLNRFYRVAVPYAWP
jgi:hypothetical protein